MSTSTTPKFYLGPDNYSCAGVRDKITISKIGAIKSKIERTSAVKMRTGEQNVLASASPQQKPRKLQYSKSFTKFEMSTTNSSRHREQLMVEQSPKGASAEKNTKPTDCLSQVSSLSISGNKTNNAEKKVPEDVVKCSNEAETVGSIIGNNIDHKTAVVLANLLWEKLRFMKLEFESFVELVETSCFKSIYKPGDVIYNSGEQEFHCVLLASGQVVEYPNGIPIQRTQSFGGGTGDCLDSKAMDSNENVVHAPAVLGVGALLLCDIREHTVCVQRARQPIDSAINGKKDEEEEEEVMAVCYLLHQKTFQNFFRDRTQNQYNGTVHALNSITQLTHLNGDEKDKLLSASEEIDITSNDNETLVEAGSPFENLYIALNGCYFSKHTPENGKKGVNEMQTTLIGWEELIEGEPTWRHEWIIRSQKENGEKRKGGTRTVLEIDTEKVDRIIGLFRLTNFQKKNQEITTEQKMDSESDR